MSLTGDYGSGWKAAQCDVLKICELRKPSKRVKDIRSETNYSTGESLGYLPGSVDLEHHISILSNTKIK